jgi:hypothetical protein
VEKNQYKLCLAVLAKLSDRKVLSHLILVGSWCAHFYEHYFNSPDYSPMIRTRDIDFLISPPLRLAVRVDIPAILSEQGFTIDFMGRQGYIRLMHPDLFIDFLVPEKGRGSDKPYPLPQLGLNAQPLRFLSFLTNNLIHLKVSGIEIILPHPANFALHKLIISGRRANKDKSAKDDQAARLILQALLDKGEKDSIKKAFDRVPPKWQKKITQGLKKTGQKEVLELVSYGGL